MKREVIMKIVHVALRVLTRILQYFNNKDSKNSKDNGKTKRNKE